MKMKLKMPIVAGLCLIAGGAYAGNLITDGLTALADSTTYGKLEVKGAASSQVSTNQQELLYNFSTTNLPVADDSANNHTGTVYLAAWTNGGRSGGGYCFNPANSSYIEVSNEGVFRKASTNNFSIAAWFACSNPSLATAQNIFSLCDPGGSPDNTKFSYYLYVYNGTLGYDVGRLNVACDATTSCGGVAQNTWHHAAAVNSNGVIRLYFNGTLVSTATNGTASTAGTVMSTFVGNSHGGITTRGFAGTLDQVYFFNKALSAEEVQQVYHSDVAGTNAGQVVFYDGIKYSAPLGDVGMGSFTNQP